MFFVRYDDMIWYMIWAEGKSVSIKANSKTQWGKDLKLYRFRLDKDGLDMTSLTGIPYSFPCFAFSTDSMPKSVPNEGKKGWEDI